MRCFQGSMAADDIPSSFVLYHLYPKAGLVCTIKLLVTNMSRLSQTSYFKDSDRGRVQVGAGER